LDARIQGGTYRSANLGEDWLYELGLALDALLTGK
jgi:hypothetical protein